MWKCSNKRLTQKGQALVEYALGAGILIAMAIAAVAALDMNTLVAEVLANSSGGTQAGSKVIVMPLGG